jgi:hypothetical protein
MSSTVFLFNVTPNQLSRLIPIFEEQGIRVEFEGDSPRSTPPPATRLCEVTPQKNPRQRPTPMASCSHANCQNAGDYYKEDDHPRVCFCCKHKPDNDGSYKTRQEFNLDSVRRHFGSNKKKQRIDATDEDEDGWFESRNTTSSPEILFDPATTSTLVATPGK